VPQPSNASPSNASPSNAMRVHVTANSETGAPPQSAGPSEGRRCG
jgi:hypothetical protein